MAGKHKPNHFPKNYSDATFKMGDHEFPMQIFFDKTAFLPIQVKKRRAKLIITQSKTEI